jgi:hypothetical protein
MNSYLLLIPVGCCCCCSFDVVMVYVGCGRTMCHRVDGGSVMHYHACIHIVCVDIPSCTMVFAADHVSTYDNRRRNICLTCVVEMILVDLSATSISSAILTFDEANIDVQSRSSLLA